MSSATRSGDGSLASKIDWGQAAGYGVGAFCAAFFLCGVFVLLNDFVVTDGFGLPLAGGWRWLVLWPARAFYGSHLGAFGFEALSGFRLGFGAGVVPGIAFLAVPVGVLVAAGYRSGSDSGADERAATVQGAATATGYCTLVAASIGVFKLLASEPGPYFGTFGTAQILVFAGVLYPAVFGGLGGLFAARRSATAGRDDGTIGSTARWSSDDQVGQSTDAGGWSSGDDDGGQSTDAGWSTGSGEQEDDVGQPDPSYAGADVTCPSCGEPVDPGVNYCPTCGRTV